MKRCFIISTLILLAFSTALSAKPANLLELTENNFNSTVKGKTVIVDFYANWCGPCVAFAPAFQQAAANIPSLTFIKVNVDNARALASRYKVRYIPHIVALRDGKEIAKYSGSRTTEAFTAWCKKITGVQAGTAPDAGDDSTTALPTSINVWAGNMQVVNVPVSGWKKCTLKIANHYTGSDGVYVAVYSHEKEGSIYSVSPTIHVMGLIRVKGRYIGRVAHPDGWVNKDISAAQVFKDLANKYFPACKGGGWVGGDTGGFFGQG